MHRGCCLHGTVGLHETTCTGGVVYMGRLVYMRRHAQGVLCNQGDDSPRNRERLRTSRD